VLGRFGAYEILHELSKGGMGSVLLGRRRGPGSFEQLVAIKTIRTEYAAAEAVRAMFLDEAAILARLNHPAVASVHDFGEEAGALYMVMEYVAGVSLRGMIGQMPPGVAARVISEACRGLHAAHELRDLSGQTLGLVHRDISPDNIMLGFDGHVKVIDFGIALVKNRQAPVTEFGTVKGKPPYMSPEQVRNEAMDRKSDVFSLGVVMHELVTGSPLFDGDSIYAIAHAVSHQEIKPPSQVLGHELPFGLDSAVMNALDRDPARRTPTAAAFAEALEPVISIAGDETLQAWAERELAAPRDAHRRWLAGVVSGHDTPRPIGRATHSVTALGSDAAVPLVEKIETPTHLPPPEKGLSRPPRRSLLVPVLLALVLLGGVIGGVVVYSKKSDAPPDAVVIAMPKEIDAANQLDAAIAADVLEPDAVPDIDAAVPVDAEVKTTPHEHTVKRDAGVKKELPIDAAVVAPPPTGFGKLTAKHRPNDKFLIILIDGRFYDHTPVFGGKIAAGAHTIELVEPDTKAVVVTKKVTVEDGEPVLVEP
jgi:predicted Ser/Thr protein kinase